MTLRVGVDLGGTNIRVALIDHKGEIVHQVHELTDAARGPEEIITQLVQMIKDVIGPKTIAGIGIGAPGPLDPVKGIILGPSNLPGWEYVELAQMVNVKFDVPVIVNNDANVAALAEAHIGSGKSHRSVFYVTVSTGVGGGFVLDGHVHNGSFGYAGEIGNMIVQPNGYKHAYMNRGSLEAYASGTAIGRVAKERYGITGGAKEVFRLMEEGDEKAKEVVEESMNYLAIGIANIAHTLDPDIFILGGGVMGSSHLVLPYLTMKVKEYLFPQMADRLTIVKASLDRDSGVIGAAMLIQSEGKVNI
ncbi:ROK family protein [Priestia koreensis]|uniref:ROK family protein n=1 Tax=Priestia koreensis TaxID=284581 RepID=UPI001F5A616C|nr:ROK family protein [Priestia koreensis]UNL85739.1 ROK family protein [Priestia koreensis]